MNETQQKIYKVALHLQVRQIHFQSHFAPHCKQVAFIRQKQPMCDMFVNERMTKPDREIWDKNTHKNVLLGASSPLYQFPTVHLVTVNIMPNILCHTFGWK